MPGKVLVVDDDPMLRRVLELELQREGIVTFTASTVAEARRRMAEEDPVAVLLDLELPDGNGKELLKSIHAERPDLPVVILTGNQGTEDVVACMRLGALDYIQKPYDRVRLATSVRNARDQGRLKARVAALVDAAREETGVGAILGDSKEISRARDLLRKAARSDVTVLVLGETGTGKELAARAIHLESARREGPFIAVNCGAIPESLIESELFGHERGAFTGAHQARAGVFERADGGTLFLDEVGELRTDLQVKLLRALQEREITRVGGSAATKVDIRIVSATNRDLLARGGKQEFRSDLFYRLSVFTVELPALRERPGDVAILAQSFLHRFSRRHRRQTAAFTRDAVRALEAYPWPGNVRELENVVERAIVLEEGAEIALASLPDAILLRAKEGQAAIARTESPPARTPPPAPLAAAQASVTTPLPGSLTVLDAAAEVGAAPGGTPSSALAPAAPPPPPPAQPSPTPVAHTLPGGHAAPPLPRDLLTPDGDVLPLEEAERRLVLKALSLTGGNIHAAAQKLGVSRATIYRKLEKWQVAGVGGG